MRNSAMALLMGLLIAITPIQAADVPPDVVQALSRVIPGVQPDSIEPSPIPDLYEVVFGPHVIYVTGDGQYVVRGDVVEIKSKKNLTEAKRNRARASAIDKLGEDSMIVFAPEKTEYTLTVFTDVDCGFCAKFHQDMATLNGYGIKVRYLAFPRAGIPSANYNEMVSVWCAEDPHDAITRAKRRESIAPKTCVNPVKDHYNMGMLVGVNGTPTLVFENGQVYPGYVPPGQLIKALRAGAG